MREQDVRSLAFTPVIATAMLTLVLCGCERYAPRVDTIAEQDEFTCMQYGNVRGSVQYNDCMKYVASQRGKLGTPSPPPAATAPATPDTDYVCRTRGNDTTCRPR
jgi:hypothetical protein